MSAAAPIADADAPSPVLTPSDALAFDDDEYAPVASLVVANPHGDKKLAFKVKTTVPESYTVRPSQGFVEAAGSVSVEICLQQDGGGGAKKKAQVPPPNWRRHKFKVDTMFAPAEWTGVYRDSIWRDSSGSAAVTESKVLRCAFKGAEQQLERIVRNSSAGVRFSSVNADPRKGSGGAVAAKKAQASSTSSASTTELDWAGLQEELARLRRERTALGLALGAAVLALFLALFGSSAAEFYLGWIPRMLRRVVTKQE